MNQRTVQLLLFLLAAFMLLSLVSQFLSFVLSKNGFSCAVLIFLMYQFYRYRKRSAAGTGNFSYYDRINTYSNEAGGYEYSRTRGGRGFVAGVTGWFADLYKRYYYWKFNRVWKRVQEKYAGDMSCPACRSELTVFNITSDGRCGYCKGRLL